MVWESRGIRVGVGEGKTYPATSQSYFNLGTHVLTSIRKYTRPGFFFEEFGVYEAMRQREGKGEGCEGERGGTMRGKINEVK